MLSSKISILSNPNSTPHPSSFPLGEMPRQRQRTLIMPHDQAYPEAEKKIEEARHSLEVKETMKTLLAFTLLMLVLTACAPA